ncbi:hypothetical protein DV737_g659, partial [Chaetothyriales sp. CBS 132003]
MVSAVSLLINHKATSPDFPHLLFYGPSGAGKKTRILATLRALYGPGAEKIKIDARVFQSSSSSRKLEFNIVSSVYHLEITPSDVGNYDRVVIQDLLKEVAQTQQVDLNAKQRFKVVKYSNNVRLILVSNSTAGIIAPIRSRTLLIRVAAPTEAEICAALEKAAKKEGWKVIPALNTRIARDSGRNLRKALLMFEAVYAQHPEPGETTPIPPPDWEVLIDQIAGDMIRERTPQMIMQVRAKLYDLLTHCIPATMILKTLCWKLTERKEVDEELKPEIVKWAAFYEHRVRLGSKVIFHLEAFVAKFMRIFEGYLMGMDF